MGTFRVPVLALLLAASVTLAAPPKLDLPAEVRPAGDYARFTPETDAASVVYVGLSGVDAFPSEELRDPRRFLLPTRGLPDGRYLFAAVAAGKGGEQTRADFAVVVGAGGTPQPPKKDPPKVDPPPVPTGLYFMVVRPDGPASPEFTKVMADPGWQTLQVTGHLVKDFTLARARQLGAVVPAGTALPCVITLRVVGDKSYEVRPAVPLPTTTEAIRRLPEGVTQP